MKKLITAIALLSATTFALTSCSKKGDYTCNCTVSISGQTQTGQSQSYKDAKKSDAQKGCDNIEAAGNASASQAGGTFDCTLTED